MTSRSARREPVPAVPPVSGEPPAPGGALRLTWVQPEDLVGHELRQAGQDGRDAAAVRGRWLAAGGHLAPDRAGASPSPAAPRLRALAEELLDELAALPSPLDADEPTDLAAIHTATRPPAPSVLPADTPAQPQRATSGDPLTDIGPARDTAASAQAPAAAGVAPASRPQPGEPRDRSSDTETADDTAVGADEPATAGTDPASDAALPGRPARPDGRFAGSADEPVVDTGEHGTADADVTQPGQLPLRQGRFVDAGAPGRASGGVQAGATGSVQAGAADGGQAGAAGGGLAREQASGPAGGLVARLEAGWLGRAVGCLLGKPVEKLPLTGIRAIAASTGNWPVRGYFTEVGLDPRVAARYPWNRRSRPTSLAGNIDGMPEDDDLNYPLLNLMLVEAHGHGFSTGDVAELWLAELPAGRTFTAERIAYRNLLLGLEPPGTATWRNPFREWIGALIRADVFGWTRPGDPVAAADEAWRDAVLTHTANGVYGAMFAAAAVARAAGGGSDVHASLAAGLSVVPPRSRLAAAVRRGIGLARREPTGTPEGFAAVVDALHADYADHHWVDVLPNAALLSAALTHADGDFTGSICRVVSGGWDTDSNGATAGSITGLLAGSPAALPQQWTTPLRNRLATTVGGFDGIGFDALARRTAAVAVTTPPPPERSSADRGTGNGRTAGRRTTDASTARASTADRPADDRPASSSAPAPASPQKGTR